MLETRDPKVLKVALAIAGDVPLLASIEAYLAEIGLCREKRRLRTLDGPRVWHIVFPPDYFDDDDKPLCARNPIPPGKAARRHYG